MRATCPAHLILFDSIILIILVKCTSYEAPHYAVFLQPPVTSSLFGSNILLSTLFSNTLSLCSSLNARDHISHPCRNTDKIVLLYILFSTLLDSSREDKRFSWKKRRRENFDFVYSYLDTAAKVKLSLCLIKHSATKMCGRE
jgi:hypothetical protein